MICTPLTGFNPACAAVKAAGVRDVYIFDAEDFDFGLDATIKSLYSTMVATNAGEVDPPPLYIYPVKFKKGGAARLLQTHSIADNGGDLWEHALSGQLLPILDESLVTFLETMQAATTCCGIGFILRLNNGKSIVIGEQIVDSDPIAEWNLRQNGTTIDTGILIGDLFGGTLNVTGQYNRPAYFIDSAAYTPFISSTP